MSSKFIVERINMHMLKILDYRSILGLEVEISCWYLHFLQEYGAIAHFRNCSAPNSLLWKSNVRPSKIIPILLLPLTCLLIKSEITKI